MPHLGAIYLHPIKGHGREQLNSVTLQANQVLPYDRIWALQHDQAQQEFAGEWIPCHNMMRGARAGRLQAVECVLNPAHDEITLTHPDLDPISIAPDTPDGAAALMAWSSRLAEPNRGRPKRVIKLPRHGLTDADFPSVSIMNFASLATLSSAAGQDICARRWRGNLWAQGWPAWAEAAMIGKTIQIGRAQLRIEGAIGRCKMTMFNPVDGYADIDMLALLRQCTDTQNFGVVARVIRGGDIAIDDKIDIL